MEELSDGMVREYTIYACVNVSLRGAQKRLEEA